MGGKVEVEEDVEREVDGEGDGVGARRMFEIVAAAISTGIQSTFLVGKRGILFMEGWSAVENMIFRSISFLSHFWGFGCERGKGETYRPHLIYIPTSRFG